MSDVPIYVTVEELATLLRVPRSWLYEQARQRTIPHLKPGKRLLFVRDEVTQWFEQACRRGPIEMRGRPSRGSQRRPGRKAGAGA